MICRILFNGVNSQHLETPDEPFFSRVGKANTAIEINRDINQIAYISSSDQVSSVLSCTVIISESLLPRNVRPQVADGGKALNMECSCEYIELAVADNRQGVVLQLGSW